MIFKRVKDLERRVKQLECEHENIIYLCGITFDSGKHFEKRCKDCDKSFGWVPEPKILQDEIEKRQGEITEYKNRLDMLRGDKK